MSGPVLQVDAWLVTIVVIAIVVAAICVVGLVLVAAYIHGGFE